MLIQLQGRHRPGWVLLLGLVLAGVVVGPAAAQVRDRGLGIALVGGPADRADDLGVGRAIYDTAQPGAPRTWKVVVENDTPEVLPVELFVVDVEATDQGLVFGQDPSTGPLGSWVTLRPASLELEPRTQAEVFVDIEVPEGADPGELLGAVVAEPPATGEGLRRITRVAVPIFLATGDDFALADFRIDSMTAARDDNGRPVVDVVATNVGPRTINLVGELTLSDGPGGIAIDPVVAANAPAVPVGKSGTVRFVLPADLPDGPWQARALLSSGSVQRAATATIEFPRDASTRAEPAPATDSPIEAQRDVLIPVNIVLLLLSIAGLSLLWLLRRRDREDDLDDEQQGPATQGVAAPAVVVEDREPADHGVPR